jgi:poly(hydroxyalkanoate) depolymerase family esterase
MRTMSDTIMRLKALRQQAAPTTNAHAGRLSPLTDFGSNPGSLKAYRYVPADDVRKGAALVVVLHGCGQSAAGYDQGAGWSHLAEEYGFVLLYPEQTRANNPNGCFNWFDQGHSRREAGEALSIRQMVSCTLERYPQIDSNKVFVTGLSAGGAMAAVMLAAYPDVFAAGAIIAGLPYGTAETVPQAFDRMRGHGFPDSQQLEALVRDASDHEGPWPALSIWHGTADFTVVPANADATLSQWLGLHELETMPSRTEHVSGHRRQVWTDRQGREVIERFDIQNMGHGTPLDIIEPSHEMAGAFMIHAGISSSRHIAAFWKIAPPVEQADLALDQSHSVPAQAISASAQGPTPRQWTSQPTSAFALTQGSVRKTIEGALRKAGLMQ